MAKLFASETAMEIALNAVRIHGGYGYSTEFDVERYFRDAPLMIVGEGTNEIQRNIIAAQLIARGGYVERSSRSRTSAISRSQGSNETFAYTAKTTPSTLDYNATTVGASTSCLPLKLRCTNIPTDPCQHFRFISGAPRLALLCFQAIQQFRALV